MGETLRSRVGRVIAGGLHAIVDKIEDQAPEAVMEQAIRELDAVIHEVRNELGTTAANRHLAQQQHADLNRKHTELAENIEQAIFAGRDDLARAAVARQLDIEAQVPVLETTLADLVNHETELKGYVDALLGKKREMQEAVDAYRASRARAGVATDATAAGVSSRAKLADATETFDRTFARYTGISPAALGATLEQAAQIKALDDLVRKNKIEERLTKLKASKKV